MPETKFALLVILDGFGIAPASVGNAITSANLINITRVTASYPHTQLRASGKAVGLPEGEPGNTETGHLNLGAGRIVYQDLERINMSIADGSFFENKTLIQAINHCKEKNSNLHVMGLIGGGGVHSNKNHLFALIHLARLQNFNRLFIHLFTDGRDSNPTSSKIYIKEVEDVTKKEQTGKIASIMGRYWAMDRDNRWERTSKAYNALTKGEGNKAKTPFEIIDNSYSLKKTDEFIEPALIVDNQNNPIGLIKDNDSVIFFNFRIDRPRQLTRNFVQKEPLKNLCFVTMTEYDKEFESYAVKVAYPRELVNMPLSRVISEAGLKQLRVAESEKERFVTFFFNGQREFAFTGEKRIIVPSPNVVTYDLKPEMSAYETTDKLLKELRNAEIPYSFALINYANPDMVGHTGDLNAAIKAVKIVDECLGRLISFIIAYGGVLLVTADHGNCEEMIDLKTGEINTEHTSNPVPFIAVSKDFAGTQVNIQSGILADIAPTILKILELNQPTEMTGRNLLEGLL
ncbi:MAG: 2,3-bisphosphoglycerate-independent phosphoglycerate mutase [Candidatus Woesebacteria bacterium]|nr:MAG: 2,3-bisphosphoglycerate-independent phosphoglycerate mutase [Candidatus Woesebacteria bacterium]